MPLRPARCRSAASAVKLVTRVHRRDERDVAAGGDGVLPVAVAGHRERRVGQQEHVAAVRDVVPVDHVVPHGHRRRRTTRSDVDQLDTRRQRRVVADQHRLGAAPRGLLGCQHPDSVGTCSSSATGPGGVPSPKGLPPSCSRPCGVIQPARSGPFGTMPRRVDAGVHDVVVPLDLVEVDGVAEARRLEQVAGVGPQHRVLGELVPVALEVAVIDGVEAHQRGEEPDVGLGDGVADQVALARQPLARASETAEEPCRTPPRTPAGRWRTRRGIRRCSASR